MLVNKCKHKTFPDGCNEDKETIKFVFDLVQKTTKEIS